MTTRPVMVLTEVDDPTADVVIAELNVRGVPVARFDPGEDFPAEVSFTAKLTGTGWVGQLETPTRRLDLSAVRSVYWRRPSPYTSSLAGQDGEFAKTQARFGLGGVLQALRAHHVNHPVRMHAADYKPAQLATAIELGFRVPPTLITNETQQAREFVDAHRPVVYKVLRQTSYDLDGSPATVWVDEVDTAELDDSVSGTAHLFQQKVEKIADIRVTVVGTNIFCVRIDSVEDLLDWRSHYSRLSYTVVTPPPGVAGALHAYLDAFGLVFGCFDFALDRNNQWHWIECHPNGQWAWLEEPTGLPMAAAFADELTRNSHGRLA